LQKETASNKSSGLVPDFIIIGAAKAGTTTLYDDLAKQLGVYLPTVKEPNILHRAESVDAAKRLYSKHFSSAPEGVLLGEASTYYTMLPTLKNVSAFARKVCGDKLKLIYIIRDPLARIRSHLSHDFAVGRIPDSDFDRAVRDDPRYIAWSNYPMQIAPWIEEFGLNNILVISFESFVEHRTDTLKTVLHHIGLEAELAAAGTTVSNQRGSQRQPRFTLVEKIVRSDLYASTLRPFLPSKLTAAFKRLLTFSRPIPEIELSHSTVRKLEEFFLNQVKLLQDLKIYPYSTPGRISLAEEAASVRASQNE